MARVIWTDKALGEVDEIGEYFLARSPHYAGALVESLIRSPDVLEEFPRLGRVVPDFDDDRFREIIIENYRIGYEIEGETVNILAVMDGRMDPAEMRRRLGDRGLA